jgi:hypothetical protein
MIGLADKPGTDVLPICSILSTMSPSCATTRARSSAYRMGQRGLYSTISILTTGSLIGIPPISVKGISRLTCLVSMLFNPRKESVSDRHFLREFLKSFLVLGPVWITLESISSGQSHSLVPRLICPYFFSPNRTLLGNFIKELSKNNSISLGCPRQNAIVPFAVEGVWQKRERRHLFIGHLASGGVGIGVESALHRQASLGRGRTDQFQDHGIAHEWLAAPVLTDPGKESVSCKCVKLPHVAQVSSPAC